MSRPSHHKDWRPALNFIVSILFFPILILLAILGLGKRKWLHKYWLTPFVFRRYIFYKI